VRELHELDLNDGDVSLVTYPAYPATARAVRSRDRWKPRRHPGQATLLALDETGPLRDQPPETCGIPQRRWLPTPKTGATQ
jgi:hypothetical protein